MVMPRWLYEYYPWKTGLRPSTVRYTLFSSEPWISRWVQLRVNVQSTVHLSTARALARSPKARTGAEVDQPIDMRYRGWCRHYHDTTTNAPIFCFVRCFRLLFETRTSFLWLMKVQVSTCLQRIPHKPHSGWRQILGIRNQQIAILSKHLYLREYFAQEQTSRIPTIRETHGSCGFQSTIPWTVEQRTRK